MTLSEIIGDVGDMRPHSYSADHLTTWVSEVDARAARDVISMAREDPRALDAPPDEWRPYSYAEDAERELLIPEEHRTVYLSYLMAMIDYYNGEYERYSADAAMYDAAWHDYAAEYRRRHRPKDYEITRYFRPSPLW